MRLHLVSFALGALALGIFSPGRGAAYDGKVNNDVPRDRSLSIAVDFSTLRWYCSNANLDYSNRPGAECFYDTTGWKTGVAYCWGGEDSTALYLSRIAAGDGPGNIDTSSDSSYETYCTGDDCSGFVSNCWTSSRYATSGFSAISNSITWEQLKRGDAINKSGSHIRLFDYFVSDINTIMVYECTAGGGALWRTVHRALAMSEFSGYVPIRYNKGTYKTINYDEPDITYVVRSGVERVSIRWDGQASTGFRLYQSMDGGNYALLRDTDQLTPATRLSEVSGLLPGVVYSFRMTSVNGANETIASDAAPICLAGHASQVLLVNAYDRYRDQFGRRSELVARAALDLGGYGATLGLSFDYAANEAVISNHVTLADYAAVVWLNGQESLLDETFSWAEQMYMQEYLDGGGRLFASGSEIAYDLVSKGNTAASYKNGHPNDTAFANTYLGIGYSSDDAGTYQAMGAAGTVFEGLALAFDNGTQGAYDVATPDVFAAAGGASAAVNYMGGMGGVAAVARASTDKGRVVTAGFPFETIYPAASRAEMARRTMQFLQMPAAAPQLVSVIRTTQDSVVARWIGYATNGYRLWVRRGAAGAWTLEANETTLGPNSQSRAISGLAAGESCAVKIAAVNNGTASADSNTMCAMPGATPSGILLVCGYDRWQTQGAGAPNTFAARYGDALAANGAAFDSCTNEMVTRGDIHLADYKIVLWNLGQEATESETFSAAEQELVKAFLRAGGRLFASGSEIGWDLVAKGGAANDYSNGSADDSAFFRNTLMADYLADDAGVYTARGVAGGIFSGLSLQFDNGSQGTYDVKYPDVLAARGTAQAALLYGTGSDVAAVTFAGAVSDSSAEARIVLSAIPFETLYPEASRAEFMARILEFFRPADSGANGILLR